MVQAYILIQTEVGRAASVAEAVRLIGGVESADDVTGPYDVIARVEASTVDELGKLVIAKIQDVEGITRTLTCTVVHVSGHSLILPPSYQADSNCRNSRRTTSSRDRLLPATLMRRT